MSFDYLNEAFKKLELLKEDTFDTSPNGLASMKSFMDADLENDSVRVIDPEADRDEDLQDSYIGKVITNCNVCHSNIFENKENIVIDEDGTVNAEKQCPYCGETMGFTVMGEVTEFVPTPDEDDEPKVTVDGEEVPVEETQDALEESVARGEKSLKPHTLKILKMLDEEPLDEELLTESGFDDRPLESWLSAMYQRDIPKKYHSLPKSTFKNSEWDFEDHLHDAIFDSSASRDMIGNRANRIVSHYKLDEFVNDLDNIKILDNPKDPQYNTALQVVDILAWCIVDAFGRSGTKVKQTHSQSTDGNKTYYSSREDTYASAGDLIANYKKYRSSIKESVNNVNVETDDSIVNIKSDEGGKVTVSTEPKEPETTGEEAIGPVSDETIADIESANAPEEEPVEEGEPVAEEEPVEYEDVDFEEVDEESFDELGESYLKRVYENVDSFRTCDVSSDDNKLIVEGIIKFKSGAEKKTGFIFEAHSASDGKVRFTGMNEHFSRGSKSFALTGKVENKKLISESLTYNYRAKVGNGKSTRIYGTISK